MATGCQQITFDTVHKRRTYLSYLQLVVNEKKQNKQKKKNNIGGIGAK